MNKRHVLTPVAAIASLALSFAVHAECTFPKAPERMPDGKTATQQQMMTAMQEFKAYNDAVTAFGDCIGAESQDRSASSAQLMQIRTLQVKKHSAAVAELQAKAKVFNEQVRLFKARPMVGG